MVSVLTACLPTQVRGLTSALASLQAQRGLGRPGWEWVIQFDGPAPALPAELADARAAGLVTIGDSPRAGGAGPAEARNRGLARCRAALVQNLDADDELEPSALAVLSGALSRHPAAAYAAGDARDLLPDGSLRAVPLELRPGVLEPGAVYSRWRTEPAAEYSVPLHPAGIMWRRSALWEFGCWPALWGMDDTALLMVVSSFRAGVYVAADTLRYRRHGGQLSGQVEQRREALADQVDWVHQRVAALREAQAARRMVDLA
ncbi:glycosyltransferase [Kitasatospora sp. MAA4]|uniref:glycosyltransferase n=1 Tax=Kitasatospora sp. MAA4 TaxID=3035093 RepID=UPI0024772B6C|nr:glycosyltransferase [Kitasatospora sp. MAA4]